jgi:hypothetical protein
VVESRRPIFPPWSAAGRRGCTQCGDPVEYAVLDVEKTDDVERVAIERAVNNTGKIAVRWIGDQLHGYRVTDLRPLRDGFVRVLEHRGVCPEQAPPAEQHPLF